MKLRIKVISLNMLIITAILLGSGYMVIRSVDNFNLYTVYQYLLSQSDSSQQYLYEYLKIKTDPGKVLEADRKVLEERLSKQVGCNVEITGLSVNKPSIIQSSALEGKRTYLIDTKGEDRQFYLSFPIFTGGNVIGIVTYEYSLYQPDNMKRSLIITIMALGLGALIVSFILSFIFSYRLIKPLEKLMIAVKEYSKGNFREVGGINSKDEIEALAKSFNDMGKNIKGMIEKLKNEQEKQKKFLDSVTHEIRTPLTNITGYADLTSRVLDEAQREKYISYIKGESGRLLNMVNDLLELSRLNTYELALKKEKTDLKLLLEQTINLMYDRCKKYGFKIESSIEPLNVVIDGEKIKQVIINLLDNAIKYSEGNLIKVKVVKEAMVYISIGDNGRGIPETDMGSIAEPFYRVDKSRSRKLGGSGLGLSICKEIIDAHGGTMSIDSKEGIGTTVTISLHYRDYIEKTSC